MTSATATTSPAPAPRAAAWPGDDFPSWMSPMLVKELRQGVQSGVFAWTFVLLQAAMFVLMALWLLERAAREGMSSDGGFFRGVFWWVFGIAAVLVIPLRASASMVTERQGQTLDLLRLTRLSASQIVVGKWLSTMAQVALLAVAVLPYVVLQYFFGGLDVIGDLTLLFLVLLGASVVTALSIATSGQPALARGLLVALVMYLAIVTAGIGMSWGSGLIAPALWTATCLVAAILTAVFLEYAAAGIAPAAENHAGRIRALVLVACLLALVFVRLGGAVSVEALTAFAALLALGVTAAEFTTDSVPVASVHARFARFGPLGRIAALFLAPGWATAIPFVLLASAILLSVFAATRVFTSEFDAWSLYFLALAVASIAFPLPAMLHFPPGQRRWWAFVLVCVASTAIHAIAAAWLRDPYSGRAIGSGMMTFLPLPALMELFAGGPVPVDPSKVFLPLLVTGLALATILPRWLREMAMLQARLGARPATPPPAAPPA